MLKNVIKAVLALGIAGCAAPQGPSAPAPVNPDPAAKEIAQLKETVSGLQNRLGHLETEVSAASAENELTAMTIDSVRWPDADQHLHEVFGAQQLVVCHVVEWRGYGKMLRFVRKADPVFVLEAEGHPAVNATIATGGVCTSDGSTRLVILQVPEHLDPTVHYRIRPRNENEQYRWAVAADLAVVAPEATR